MFAGWSRVVRERRHGDVRCFNGVRVPAGAGGAAVRVPRTGLHLRHERRYRGERLLNKDRHAVADYTDHHLGINIHQLYNSC